MASEEGKEKIIVRDRRRSAGVSETTADKGRDARKAAAEEVSNSGESEKAGVDKPTAASDETSKRQVRKVDFSSFVFGLYTQVVVALGEVPHPESGERSVNLSLAKEVIDIMGVLQEKTRGNLDDTEKGMLEELLAQVRMAYVEKAK